MDPIDVTLLPPSGWEVEVGKNNTETKKADRQPETPSGSSISVQSFYKKRPLQLKKNMVPSSNI